MQSLVCQYCKKSIYAGGGSEGYLHATTARPNGAAPQLEGLQESSNALRRQHNLFRVSRSLIMQMTNTMYSYAEATPATELLEMLLANAHHLADIKSLASKIIIDAPTRYTLTIGQIRYAAGALM